MKYASIVVMMFFCIDTITAQQPRLAIRNYAKSSDTTRKKAMYTMDQFIGRWQEISRMKTGTKEKTEVTDTLYIHFYKEGTADTKQGNSLVITGTSELFTDNYITTSANDFKVVSVSPDMIVLDDLAGYQRNMARKNNFAYELSKPVPVAEPDTVKMKIAITAGSLIKDWFAYKRSAEPGFITPETPLIRNLRIRTSFTEYSYSGEIEFARSGKAYVQSCTLSFNGNWVSIVTVGNTWNLEVYKADEKEMILGKMGEVTYYFKNGN